MTFLYIIIATLLISLGSLVGIFTLTLKEKILNKWILKLVALSSGALLGSAFIHLLPEGAERIGNNERLFYIVLLAIMIYLIVEKILHWRHCHSGVDCPSHTFGHMNLIGDSVHNFIDGLIIASVFIINVPLGITTSLAIAMHEIPQEIGDFGVLVYSGIEKKRALLLNFLVSLSAVGGALVGWFLFSYTNLIAGYLMPVAAGGFIYISLSDMLPELRKEPSLKSFFVSFAFILAGIFLMLLIKLAGGN